MGILSALLSLLGLGLGIGGSIAGSQEAEDAEKKAAGFRKKTGDAQKERAEKAEKERKRKALAKAIGADDLFFERDVEMPETPEISVSTTPQIVSGIGTGVSGLGSFLQNLPTASRTDTQKQPEIEQIDINKLFPEDENSGITRLT